MFNSLIIFFSRACSTQRCRQVEKWTYVSSWRATAVQWVLLSFGRCCFSLQALLIGKGTQFAGVHGCGCGKELRVVLLAGVMLICTSRPGCPALRPRVTPAVGIHTDVSRWTQQPAADYRVSWRDKKKISDIFGGAPEWAFDGQNGL